MKTKFLKTAKLLIFFAMTFILGQKGHGQTIEDPVYPVSDTMQLKICDATFKDMMPLMTFPANVDLTNMVAFAPVDQNDYNKEYFWDFGDGTKDTGKVITHKYANAGKYLVSLHVVQHIIGIYKSFEIECSGSQWVNAGNNIPPFCDASFRPLVYTTMDYPSSGSEVVGFEAQYKNYKTYNWDFGDGSQDTGRYVRHYYVSDGLYKVTLTIKDDSCTDTKSILISKRGDIGLDKCDANLRISGDKNSVTFYDQPVQTLVALEPDGNYETWTWDFGDGQSAFGNNVTHTYAKAGKYMATLTKSSYYNPCWKSPETCFAAPVLNCTKIQKIEVVIGEPESKCKAEISHKITNNTLEIQDNIVYTYTLRDINTISERRHWDFGDGNDTVSNNPVSHTYTSSGKYRVRLIKSILNDPCPFIHDTLPRCLALPYLICMDTTYLDIEIPLRLNSYCKARLSHSVSGNKLTIIDSSDYSGPMISVNNTWNFGDSDPTILTGITPKEVSHVYENAGKYRVKLTKHVIFRPLDQFMVELPFKTDTLCSDTTYLDVEIGNVYPTCKAKLDYTINGSTVEISDKLVYISKNASIVDPISEYTSWDFGDGSTTFLNSAYSKGKVSHSYSTSGKYRIRLIKSLVKDPCPFIHDTLPRCKALALPICTDTTYLDVEIENRYFTCQANLNHVVTDTYLEIKDNNVLSTRGGYNESRKWDFGDENDTIANNFVTHTYAKAGKYSVRLIKSIIKTAEPDSVDNLILLAMPIVICTDTTYLDVEIGNSLVASIYPNPASDYMTISLKNNFNKMDLRLYDQTGKLKKEVFEILSDAKEIDTNGLENGLYFYTLSEGTKTVLKGKIAVAK